MSRRLLGMFMNPTQNVGTQAIVIDPQKISLSLQNFSANNQCLLRLYETFKNTVTHVKDKLQLTEDLIEKLAEELSNVEDLITRMSEQILKEEEIIKQGKEKLFNLRKEVAESKSRLAKMQKGRHWDTKVNRKLPEPDRIEMMRKERAQMYSRTQALHDKIDNLCDEANDYKKERCDIKDLRDQHQHKHTVDMSILQKQCCDIKHKGMILNKADPKINGVEIIQLFVPKGDQLLSLETNFADLNASRACLHEYIRDQRGQHDIMLARNEEVSNILYDKRGDLFRGKSNEYGIPKSVITSEWHKEKSNNLSQSDDSDDDTEPPAVGLRTLLNTSPTQCDATTCKSKESE